jgi:hypothetical protein
MELKFSMNSWRAVYMETCTCGSEEGARKPDVERCQGAEYPSYFYEMLKHNYPGQIDFHVEEHELQFKNQALLDVLSDKS